MNQLATVSSLDALLAGKATTTAMAYKSAIFEFQIWLAGREFTISNFRAWLAELSGLQSANTVNKKRAAIVWFAKTVRDEAMGNYDNDPAMAHSMDVRWNAIKSVKTRKVKGAKLGKWLTKEEGGVLLAAAKGETKLAIALMIGCGLRVGELFGMTMEKFQYRSGRLVIVDIEHKARVRSVPVPSWIKSLLPTEEGAAILPGLNERASTPGSFTVLLTRMVKRVLDATGFEEFTNHDLRRTAARMWYEAGSDILQIAQLLGHGSVNTTSAYIGATIRLVDSPVDLVSFS